MRKILVVLCLLVPFAAHAQIKPPVRAPVADNIPVKSELDKIFNGLVNQLKEVDNLAASLKATANKKPEDTQAQINDAAATLSTLADRLQPTGDLAAQLKELRNAAATHRQRIQDMPKDSIEESDRTSLLKAWDKVAQDADKGAAAMGDMRDRLMSILTKLRMRQVAVSEFMLAGQYQAAVDTLKNWVDELNATVNSLHMVIDPVKPMS